MNFDIDAYQEMKLMEHVKKYDAEEELEEILEERFNSEHDNLIERCYEAIQEYLDEQDYKYIIDNYSIEFKGRR